MRKRLFIALLTSMLALPIGIHAQDTEVTPAPTVESTLVATETPVTPSPVNTAEIPAWVGTILIVLVLGIVSVSVVGIVQAAKGLPMWARDILLAVAGQGLVSLDEYAKTTPTPIDNAAVAELRKEFELLKLQLADVVAQSPKLDGRP